jgi:hypothetical protein
MSHPKYRLRGYLYQIVEVFPCEEADLGVRELTTHDRLEDAETVMAALESVNYNFTCYAIILRPVWESRTVYNFKADAWDANGSPVV